MGLTVTLAEGRAACGESIEAFLRAVDAVDEHALLDVSRCHGWTRLDVVVHVLAGWQEMLGGLVSLTDDAATVDAATYWPAFASAYRADDPVPEVMAQRRRTAAYARPSAATAQAHDVAAALLRGIAGCPDGRRLWQGQVFTSGDFLAVWAVENVVHHLDLLSDVPAPASALRLARTTVDELAGRPLPDSWSDLDATLVGSGRAALPPGSGVPAAGLPVLG